MNKYIVVNKDESLSSKVVETKEEKPYNEFNAVQNIYNAKFDAVIDSLEKNYNIELKDNKIIHIDSDNYKRLLLEVFNIEYNDKYHKMDSDNLRDKLDIVQYICKNEEYINFKHKLNFVEFNLSPNGINTLYEKLDISPETKLKSLKIIDMEKINHLCNEIEEKDKLIAELSTKVELLEAKVKNPTSIKNVIFDKNDKSTTIFWDDNSKTSIHTSSNDRFYKEKGILYTIAKKFLKGSDYRKIKEKDYNFEKPIE